MGATPTAESAALTGAWVADVRRRKGLTARDLGSLTGLRLWDIERLETGRPAPAGAVERIAEATGMPVPGLATAGAAVEAPAAPAAHRARERVMATLPDDMAVRVVLGSLIFLIVVRFFTEKVHVLPGAANFVDVPLFFTLLLATILVRPSGERRSFGLARPAAAFIVLCVISVLVNIQRVDPAPALMFVYGFLGPIVV
ncbi:MAG: hypothetical protein QOJ46_989, partial [bacterium]